MKRRLAIQIVSVFAAILAIRCHAQFNGSDDFNDNITDPARWGPDLSQGGGVLAERNGRLEFTTGGVPVSSALVARPWVLNFGSYTQDWHVQIDANLPALGFAEALFGLIVTAGTNATSANRLQWTLSDSSSGARQFLLKFQQTGSSFDRIGETNTGTTLAGLRIAFDASTKVLSAYYDEDGPNAGYSWTLLGSTNISAAWGMTATSVFGAWVFGRVEETGRTITSGDQIYGDNYFAATGANLGLKLIAGNVVVSWPENASGYRLQSTAALPAAWQDVTNVPTVVISNFTVTNTVSGDKRFYRLSR